jgi:methylated-DNA-[protein]-cysteine S-methyltransferase
MYALAVIRYRRPVEEVLPHHANPVSRLVACHGVVGTSGSLTGYGGGLQRQEWLLQHEGALRL